MSDLSPSPAKSGQQVSKNQVKMLAVLGVALLAVLVLFVLKPFGGGDGSPSSAPVAPAASTPDVQAPAAGPTESAGVGSPVAGAAATPAAPAPAPPRGRNPFDPPR